MIPAAAAQHGAKKTSRTGRSTIQCLVRTPHLSHTTCEFLTGRQWPKNEQLGILPPAPYRFFAFSGAAAQKALLLLHVRAPTILPAFGAPILPYLISSHPASLALVPPTSPPLSTLTTYNPPTVLNVKSPNIAPDESDQANHIDAMKPELLLTTVSALLGASAMAHEQSTGHVQTGDGVKLSYTQSGPTDGRPILFIPGWRQAAAEWRKQVEYFSAAGFRVTTYDMRGHGESEKPEFGYRISRFAADLNDVLAELELKDVTIVGHSMGSSVAWAWWDQYPDAHDTLSTLVMADQSAVMVQNPAWTDEESAGLAATFTPVQVYEIANDMAAQTPALLQSMFTESIPEEEYDWIVEQNAKMSDENAAALLLDHAFKDWRDVLPRITVPSLVLAGNLSIFPHAGIEWVASQIPEAEQYTFSSDEKGSHFAFWENPDKFNAVVEEFLAK